MVQGMEEAQALARRPVPEGLGWEPLDLSAPGTSIPELLRQCSWIDHSVAGVTHMQVQPSSVDARLAWVTLCKSRSGPWGALIGFRGGYLSA